MESRKLAIYTLLGVVALGLIYGLWVGVINKGTLGIVSSVPFSVQIDNEMPAVCGTSPCEFRVKAGAHTLVIRKDGFTDYAKQIEAPRSERTEVVVTLEKIVKIESVVEKKDPPAIANPFVIQTNKVSGVQALVKKGEKKSDSDETIAYFSQPFTRPKIVPSRDGAYAWIDDTKEVISEESDLVRYNWSLYQVDTKQKRRTLVYTMTSTDKGASYMPTEDGRFVAIFLKDQIDVVNTASGGVKTLNIQLDIGAGGTNNPRNLFAWKDSNVFFFVEAASGSSTDGGVELKRSSLENPSQEDLIGSYSATDTIRMIFNDIASGELRIKSADADSVVKY